MALAMQASLINMRSIGSFNSSGIQGQKLSTAGTAAASNSARIFMTAAEKPAGESSEAKKKKPAPEGFTPPTLNPNTPSPIFLGSTGGLLRAAQVEEFYVITWDSPKEQMFEMPTSGVAVMRAGPNLVKLARKEQCLQLGVVLRSKYKINYQFYRVFPNGEVQYLHPKDGVYPEKVNAGRKGAGILMRSIGQNEEPAKFRFTGKSAIDLAEERES